MMSTTAGAWRSGGDGVIHSPTSTATSAITPSKGARITIFSNSTSIAAIWALALSTSAPTRLQEASDASKMLRS